MSIRAAQRLGTATRRLLPSTFIRATGNIASGGMGRTWADKEHAAEKQYFNKKDAEMLAKLASKLKNHTEPTAMSLAQEKEALSAIFEKHNTTPSEALLEDIVKFKFNNH